MDEKILDYGFSEQELEELLTLVSELAEKFTGSESTSVSYERAQSLMEAVLYCMGECGQSGGVVPTDMTLWERYEAGLSILREKTDKIRRLFNALSDTFDDYGVKCLSDTVKKGIPEFLRWYDIIFAPQETILTLDYPLLIDIGNRRGADAVYEYLCAIETEQRFLGELGRGYVVSVLERFDACYEDMIENICGVVLPDVFGHAVLKKNFVATSPGFGEDDIARLAELFAGKPVDLLEKEIKQFTGSLVARYYGGDVRLREYLCAEAGNLAARISMAARCGSLGALFHQ